MLILKWIPAGRYCIMERPITWIAEPGTYELRVGSSSDDITQTATFTVASEIVIEKGLVSLAEGVEV